MTSIIESEWTTVPSRSAPKATYAPKAIYAPKAKAAVATKKSTEEAFLDKKAEMDRDKLNFESKKSYPALTATKTAATAASPWLKKSFVDVIKTPAPPKPAEFSFPVSVQRKQTTKRTRIALKSVVAPDYYEDEYYDPEAEAFYAAVETEESNESAETEEFNAHLHSSRRRGDNGVW